MLERFRAGEYRDKRWSLFRTTSPNGNLDENLQSEWNSSEHFVEEVGEEIRLKYKKTKS
jgi:hypothetical protein